MKPVTYSDGSISREIDPPWEETGSEEMNKIYEKLKKKQSLKYEIETLVYLLSTCANCIDKDTLNDYYKVLLDVVKYSAIPKLKEIGKELSKL